jgi:hypothetical protein
VQLDGRASRHPASAPLSFQWSFTGGPAPARLSSDTTATPSVDLTTPGTYTFGLRVYDAYRTSQLTEVAISVDDLPPSCGAGTDRLVPTGVVKLEGWATDPNRQPLGLTWVQIKGPRPAALADPRAAVTTFAVPIDATGLYVFVLRATDGAQTTASAPVTIEVDDPPEAHAYANPATLDPGQAAELNGAGCADKNPEDNPLAHAWTVAAGPEKGELSGADQPYARFSARRAGEYALKLEITGRANRRTAQATTALKVRNVAPVAQIAGGAVAHRDEVELDGSGSTDDNGDPLTYEWKQLDGPEPLRFSDAAAPRPKVSALRPGEYRVRVYSALYHLTSRRGTLCKVWPRQSVAVLNPRGKHQRCLRPSSGFEHFLHRGDLIGADADSRPGCARRELRARGGRASQPAGSLGADRHQLGQRAGRLRIPRRLCRSGDGPLPRALLPGANALPRFI